MKQTLIILSLCGILCSVGCQSGAVSGKPDAGGEQPTVYCDKAHKVPFIPAEQCGGMTSCDRYAIAHALGGNAPWDCPK